LLVNDGDVQKYEQLFHSPPKPEVLAALSQSLAAYACRLYEEIGPKVKLVAHRADDFPSTHAGAVLCGMSFLLESSLSSDGDYVLVVSGDQVYPSGTAAEILERFACQSEPIPFVSLRKATISEAETCSVVTGTWIESVTPKSILTITAVKETPTLEYSRTHLKTDGLDDEMVLALHGLSVVPVKLTHDLLADELDVSTQHRDHTFESIGGALDDIRLKIGLSGFVVGNAARIDLCNPSSFAPRLFGQ